MKFHATCLFSLLVFAGCDSDENDSPGEIHTVTRLKSVTWHFQNAQDIEFSPNNKSVYSYSTTGKLLDIEYSKFNVAESKFDVYSTSSLTYENDTVSSLTEIRGDEQITKITYHYDGGILKKINVDEKAVDTEGTVQQLTGDTLEIFYRKSNGRSFTYRISTSDNNIEYERVVDDSHRIASKITNEFDSGINPFRLLGYIDPFFVNFSRNNKTLTTNQYFLEPPESVAVNYDYTYDEKGFPTMQIITHRNYLNGDVVTRAKAVFEYVVIGQ